MHLETLKLYCDLVRLRSYSRAGEENHVSQSAVSQSIAKLEADLGVLLVDRRQRPFVITPQGQAFYEACLDLVAGWDRALSAITKNDSKIDGTVRLAAIYSVGVHEVSRYLQEFATGYPEAKVELECLHPHKVVEAVLNGDADVGIMSYPPSDRDLIVVDLPAEPMVFVCQPGHRLARRKTIKPADLNGEGLVAFEPALMIRKAIDRTFRHHGVQPNVVLEFDNIDTIKQAVAVGRGVSILPRPTVESEVELGTLVAIPIGIADLVRPLGIIRARARPMTPTIERFVEVVRGSGEAERPKRKPRGTVRAG